MSGNSRDQESEFPSVKLAYPLAINSYEELRRSRESIHSLLISLLSIALSLLLAMSVVAQILDLKTKSCDVMC